MGPIGDYDLTPIVYLAIVGAVAIVAFAVFVIWWLISHLAWVA